jgi:hypothetical protein
MDDALDRECATCCEQAPSLFLVSCGGGSELSSGRASSGHKRRPYKDTDTAALSGGPSRPRSRRPREFPGQADM